MGFKLFLLGLSQVDLSVGSVQCCVGNNFYDTVRRSGQNLLCLFWFLDNRQKLDVPLNVVVTSLTSWSHNKKMMVDTKPSPYILLRSISVTLHAWKN